MAEPLPPIDELFDRFYVDSTSPSGLRNARKIYRAEKDEVTGTPQGVGYYTVKIRGTHYLTHRIVHALRTGCDQPDKQIDHIDRNRGNNHPFNLRWVTANENQRNKHCYNKNDLKGVRQRGSRWEAFITVNSKQAYLGMHDTPEQAHQAYLNAVQTYQLS